jgi:hypothetical protein
MRERSIVSDGHFACDAMTTDFQFVLKNGQTGSISLRQIDALEKIAGNWEIVLEDISAPMDPKTGMAELSGLPARGGMGWTQSILAGPAVSAAEGHDEILAWANAALRSIGLTNAMKAYGPGKNDALLYGEMAPGNVRGKPEIAAYYGPVMGSFSSVDLQLPLLTVNSDGLLGAQIDIQDLTLHLNSGTARRVTLREIDCLHRINGKWYSIAEMVSFPVDLKTGKSVMSTK